MDHWIERAQAAEARVNTLQDQIQPTLEKVQVFRKNMEEIGIKELDGNINIDFDKLVEGLGLEQSMELKKIIEEKWN